MALNNFNNTHSFGNAQRPVLQSQQKETPKPVEAKKLPANYVDLAESVPAEQYKKITTSKLRNILGMLMDVYNVEMFRTEKTLTADSIAKLQLARIRIAYECGRDSKSRDLRDFIINTDILAYLKGIDNSRELAINYIHYVESLVAYHRYYGGREN